MDPLTGLSVAGAIVQFVDFGSRTIVKSYQLQKSTTGSLSANEELERVATDLSDLVIKLQRPLDLREPITKDEQALKDLCDACSTVANDLIRRLDRLKVQGRQRAWESFGKAIKAAWTEKDIYALGERLSRFKEALEMRVIVGLRETIDQANLKQSARFDALDESTQQIITALLDSRNASSRDLQDQTITLAQMMNRTEAVIVDQHDKTRTMIIDALRQARASTDENGETVGNLSTPSVGDVVTKLQDAEKKIKLNVEELVLETLRFSTISNRYEEVVEAHQQTFKWVFSESLVDQPWDNFVEWLRSGKGIYWVNGKAGSGKSTLMRYIYDHGTTRKELLRWAGKTPLSAPGFFFWNSGTVEQRSHIGLLRSLLYEVLQQHRVLISTVVPWLWARNYSQIIYPSNLDNHEDGSLTLSKLMRAFQTLLRQVTIPLKLCFFIDGLDEFDGDHEMIADLFKSITSSQNVKACLSSRPLLVFEDAFRESLSLRLQDLTFGDIKHYVSDKLDNNPKYQRLAIEEPERAPELVQEIVLKADGVFLWVTLVVKSLLAGLGNRDEISDLQKRLRLLPSDLKDLYSHMLGRIDPFYQGKASELFQIVRASRDRDDQSEDRHGERVPLTILALGLAYQIGEDEAISTPIRQWDFSKASAFVQRMEDHLKVWCAGLLEVQGIRRYSDPTSVHGKVQYLHRTVKDYLEMPDIWNSILAKAADSSFNPNTRLLRSCVLQLKVMSADLQVIPTIALEYSQRCDIAGLAETALLDELNRIMIYYKGSWSDDVRFSTPADWRGVLCRLLFGSTYANMWMTSYERAISY